MFKGGRFVGYKILRVILLGRNCDDKRLVRIWPNAGSLF